MSDTPADRKFVQRVFMFFGLAASGILIVRSIVRLTQGESDPGRDVAYLIGIGVILLVGAIVVLVQRSRRLHRD